MTCHRLTLLICKLILSIQLLCGYVFLNTDLFCFKGPNHMPMQGSGPNQLNMTNNSMNMPSNNHGSMGGYNHSVPSSQSMPGQSQMTMSQGQPMGNYVPRPNISMQPNQGKIANVSPTIFCI